MAFITARRWRMAPDGTLTATDAEGVPVLNPQWLDVFSDTGSGTLEIPVGDALLDDIGFDGLDLIQFLVDDEPAWVLYPNPSDHVLIARNEEIDELVTLGGLGHLGLTDRGLVFPVGGPNRIPKQTTRFFNWTSIDYDDSAWDVPKDIASIAIAKVFWPVPVDPAFPWDTTIMLWADNPGGNVSTITAADPGECWFRQAHTFADSGRYRVYFLTDNYGEFYLDGQQIGTSDDFQRTSTFEVDISDGDHMIAVHGVNADWAVGPGGIAWFIGLIVDDGVGDTDFIPVIDSNSTNTLVVPYATEPPGSTAGTAIIQVLTEWADLGGLVITPSFDDVLDSAGNPWTDTADIATTVGRSVLEFFHELHETYVDFRMDPDLSSGLVLHAYEKDTHGTLTGIDYIEAVNIGSLVSHRENVPTTALLIETTDTWMYHEDSGAIATLGAVHGLLSLGAPSSAAEIERIALAQLAAFAHPREQIDVEGVPVDALDTPYLAFIVGDYVGVYDHTGVPVTNERVVSITVEQDSAVGTALFALSFREIVLTPDERWILSVQRML